MLEHDGWLAWNEEAWGLTPLRVAYGGTRPDEARLEGVLYLTKRGKVQLPPRNPYLPLRFTPTATRRRDRIEHQRLELVGALAEDLARRGTIGTISFPPGFLDVRPFQWRGFESSLRYTYLLALPFRPESLPKELASQIRAATRSCLHTERTDDWASVAACLVATENRKGFRHHTPERVLRRLQGYLGDERLRAFLTSLPDGTVVGSLLRLHTPGGTTIAWSQGTPRRYLRLGAVPFGVAAALRDVSEGGALQYDFAGANMPSVARFKSAWGAPLVAYATISYPGPRDAARQGARALKLALRSAFVRSAFVRSAFDRSNFVRSAFDRGPSVGGAFGGRRRPSDERESTGSDPQRATAAATLST